MILIRLSNEFLTDLSYLTEIQNCYIKNFSKAQNSDICYIPFSKLNPEEL